MCRSLMFPIASGDIYLTRRWGRVTQGLLSLPNKVTSINPDTDVPLQ